MKKAINQWSFRTGMKMFDCISLAKEAGYDGFEPAIDEHGEINLQSSEKSLIKFKNYAEELGVELPSLATGLYWKYSLTSENKAVREKAKDIVKKQLETAAILSADTVLVVPGAVGVDFIAGSEIVSYEKAYDYSLEALSELKVEAEKMKVSIGIENVWNKFLLSPLEMRDYIDKIGSRFVGAYLDVGNIVYTGYPEQWIRILGQRIKKLHFKDFKRSVGNLSGFVDLLAGDVNYPEVIKALEEINYNDYVTAEMAAYNYYSNQIIFNTSDSMDIILGRKGETL